MFFRLVSLKPVIGLNDGSSGLNSLLLGTSEMTIGLNKSRPSHLALTVARYTHNRLDPCLPYLALQTLTTLAEKVEVPLVACLGPEAEGIKDSLLTRLDSATEDLRIKMTLLRLLKVSTIHQPGLLRLFLTPLPPLLDPITSLLRTQFKSSSSGNELIASLLELLAALWGGNYATATAYLRENKEFWKAVINPLHSLPPNEISDDLTSHTLQLLSLEYFVSQVNIPVGLQEGMNKLLNAELGYLCSWSKHILNRTCQSKSRHKTLNILEKETDKLLLTSWRDFLVVIMTKSKKSFTQSQLSSLAEDVLNQLLEVFDVMGDFEDNHSSLLSELHLSLVINCGKEVGDEEYVKRIGYLLGKMQACVMKVPAKCQVLILASALKCLTVTPADKQSQDSISMLIEPVLHLVNQHCSLARGGETTAHCSSPAVLSLAVQLLHHCFIRSTSITITSHLSYTHLLTELATTASASIKDGYEDVIEQILGLFTLVARNIQTPYQITTQSLAESISLSLSSQNNQTLISELVWTVIATLEKEGVMGIEGAVNIAAVHLDVLVSSLLSPHQQPNLALATTMLVATLVPHRAIWQVNHRYCYTSLVSAIASCVHITTHLLSVPGVLEREIGIKSNKPASCETPTSKTAKSLSNIVNSLSSDIINLINQLLQVLCSSLRALRGLGPNLTDLLCHPGLDLSMWLPPIIQPSFRRISADHPDTQPNLATLSAILDLYHTYAPKEGRGTSPNRSGSGNIGNLSLSILSQCAEEALYLLVTQSGLVLISGEVSGRDAREIKNFLADETNTFFSHWLGRKTTPLLANDTSLSHSSATQPDTQYLKLAKHIVESLCRAKMS